MVNVVYVVICGQSLLKRWCVVTFHLLIPKEECWFVEQKKELVVLACPQVKFYLKSFKVLKPESHENLVKSTWPPHSEQS